MAILSDIIFYPVKSCAGISVPEAVLTEAGLAVGGVSDREWMVVDPHGQFLTQREYPRMALVTPRLNGGVLELAAPGMAPHAIAIGQPACAATIEVQVWDDTVLAEDCGDASAAWISQAIGAPCRLVRFAAGARRLTSTRWTAGVAAPTAIRCW
jgi:uncharacterized protein YcbX